ncbi:DNA adenine methylase [Curtobacterium sp. SL109]|uniref:DNA adenine methylase n=1 Tax=Curtobacterium sp. SL109 TaxID=2994662 RepID=UPI002272A22F|nr:DNA adenine methylase [Curtobacterium sp. SL109]MCY1694864.1 DNA adenine methylase [Curtobacterium sp. SL109]
MAAVIRVASDIAASPGHTAQPFQPSEVLLPHIRKAWSLDVLSRLRTEVESLSSKHAVVKGEALVGDAEAYAAASLRDGDVVFLDPPYSEAQYGRFYHVLEGIARGGWGVVSGAGRAPAPAERASSEFSRKSRAREAMLCLLKSLRSKQLTAVLTYPEGLRSNDLTWEFIAQEAGGLGFVTEISHVPMSQFDSRWI